MACAAVLAAFYARRAAAARREAASAKIRCDEAQALLERTRRAAEEANRAKSLFLANMSHELRTPLHAIIDYSAMAVEVLEPEQEASELTADLNRIGAAARHLLAVIDTILDLSRAEAGHTRLVVESFDVAAAMREIAEAAAPLVAGNDNTLELQCGDALGVMRSDSGKLRQVLLNLLSNAGKFTERGRVVLQAARSADGRELTFAVRDTGAGMTPEQRKQLFQPFGVADDSSHGAGLGLALSRRLCALMGGDISVDSAPGAGSTFSVRLPASVPEFAASGVYIAPAALAREPQLVS
ncbi:MAG TPA: HAMP domain-containing sensor histidine kinase [Gemmatimonadaceae bacterium]|nr:HAMP domain-containing sensor histidine kinase [Gemmatimonadaceae bacterium]